MTTPLFQINDEHGAEQASFPGATTAGVSTIGDLMQRLNACLGDPSSETVGSFAATIHALQAELALVAGIPDDRSFCDWDAILGSDDSERDAESHSLTALSAEQLAQLSP
jgi:hypothetical protein